MENLCCGFLMVFLVKVFVLSVYNLKYRFYMYVWMCYKCLVFFCGIEWREKWLSGFDVGIIEVERVFWLMILEKKGSCYVDNWWRKVFWWIWWCGISVSSVVG